MLRAAFGDDVVVLEVGVGDERVCFTRRLFAHQPSAQTLTQTDNQIVHIRTSSRIRDVVVVGLPHLVRHVRFLPLCHTTAHKERLSRVTPIRFLKCNRNLVLMQQGVRKNLLRFLYAVVDGC